MVFGVTFQPYVAVTMKESTVTVQFPGKSKGDKNTKNTVQCYTLKKQQVIAMMAPVGGWSCDNL